MNTLARMAAGMAAALALAGCGGGSTEDERPDLQIAVVTGDPVIEAGGQLFRGSVSCGSETCDVTFLGETTTIDLGDMDPNAAGAAIADRRKRNGVDIGRMSATQGGFRLSSYGVWGKYNGGSATRMTGSLQGVSVKATLPYSAGHATGSNPVGGSASWTGAMAGVKVGGSSIGAEVTGDAGMTADFDAAAIDLAFTNVSDRSGTSSPAIRWQNVPMGNGSFVANGLEGRFYGPGHVEAGGVFNRAGIEGTFSLARQ